MCVCILSKENSQSSDFSKDARKVQYVSYLVLCHLNHVELSKEMQETGDFETHNAKNDEEQHADFINQGVSASLIKVVKFLNIIV